MLKRLMSIFLFAVLLVIFVGCQAAPNSIVVTSKNDGTFEAAIKVTSDSMSDTKEDCKEMDQEMQSFFDGFTSTDGSIHYNIDLEMQANNLAMPIVQVTPHTFTSAEAETIARALFGEAEFYEYSEEKSKEELEEIILDLKGKIADWDSLVEYYGGDEVSAQAMVDMYETQIQTYSALYESAPDEVDKKLCDWEFRPLSYYEDTTVLEAMGSDFESYNKSLYVEATTKIDGLPYFFSVCNRDESDYRIHSVFAYLDLPGSTASLYSSLEMTETDLEETREEVETILECIGIGEWTIDACEIRTAKTREEDGGDTLYHIYVKACPVYNGVKATSQKQLMSLKSDDVYASNYYYESITFDYSGGHLISFEYQAPLDKVGVLNDDVEVLSLEGALEKLKTHLQTSTIKETDPSNLFYYAENAEYSIERVELGLVRTRIKNNETDFYMVPSYTFYGSYVVYDADGGVLDRSMDYGNEVVIAVVNAVDGSIINTQLGY